LNLSIPSSSEFMNLERSHVSDADQLSPGATRLDPLVTGSVAVVAAILVGGRSQRMGSDKALLAVNGTTLLDRTVTVLRDAGIEVITVLGGPALWADDRGLNWRPDDGAHGGPALAIAGFLDELHASDVNSRVVIVACDLARIDPSVVVALVTAAALSASGLVVAATDRLHPTAACWSSAVAPRLRTLVDGGQRRLVELVTALGAQLVSIEPLELMANVNTPADLAALDWPLPGRNDPAH
jgi:molybdenum cofactor guanylyltransferase